MVDTLWVAAVYALQGAMWVTLLWSATDQKSVLSRVVQSVVFSLLGISLLFVPLDLSHPFCILVFATVGLGVGAVVGTNVLDVRGIRAPKRKRSSILYILVRAMWGAAGLATALLGLILIVAGHHYPFPLIAGVLLSGAGGFLMVASYLGGE